MKDNAPLLDEVSNNLIALSPHAASQPLKLIVWFLTSSFYAFQMTLRILPAIMLDYLSHRMHIDAGQMGMLAGCYYIGYAGAQIPVGLLLDKYQPRYIIFGCIMLCVSGLYISIDAVSIYELFAARILIGVGSVAGILGAVKVIGDYFPERYGLMLGFTVLIGVCGAYYGAEPVRKLLQLLSYQEVLQTIALFGIILAVSILVLYSRPKQTKPAGAQTSLLEVLWLCLKNRQLWCVGIFGGLMVGPLEGFADLWGIKYLVQIHHLTKEEASLAITLIFLGLGIGGPVLGYFATPQRALATIINKCGIIMVVMFALLFIVPNLSVIAIYGICLTIGIFSAYQVLSFSLITKIANNSAIGIATSVVNMLIMIFGSVYHMIIGLTLSKFFISEDPDILIYSAHAFHSAFAIIVVGIMIGSIGFYNLSKKLN